MTPEGPTSDPLPVGGRHRQASGDCHGRNPLSTFQEREFVDARRLDDHHQLSSCRAIGGENGSRCHHLNWRTTPD